MLANGCERCRPAPAAICCDIHEPSLATSYTSAIVKTARQLCRSRLPTVKDVDDESNTKDQALRRDLELWRCDQAKKVYGLGHVRSLGPGLVMGLSTRERIVDCARHAKIKTVDQLERETKWGQAIEYGPEIIKLIEKHYPSYLPPTIVQHRMPLSNNNTQPTLYNGPRLLATKRQVTCSACHKQGHIRRLSIILSLLHANDN